MDNEKTIMNASVIVDGIAFEVSDDGNRKKIIAKDLQNPAHRASFCVQGNCLVMSVSSFREPEREQALIDAVRINSRLLMDEVHSA